MEFIYLFFYACLRLQFPDVATNPGQQRPVPTVCRLLYTNVWGLAGNLSDLTVACLSMTYCCAQRLWSLICVMCRGCWFLDILALSCCAGEGYLEPD